jgi:hypothetical protein
MNSSSLDLKHYQYLLPASEEEYTEKSPLAKTPSSVL